MTARGYSCPFGRTFLQATLLEDRTAPSAVPLYAVGTDAGGPPLVNVYRADGSLHTTLTAYAPEFTGGVRVATGEVTGDGTDDIVLAPGPGGGPHVRVVDGQTGGTVHSFFAYSPGYTGGVNVAVGDVTGDGNADIVAGTGVGGGPHVQVFDGATGQAVRSFFAYPSDFGGGVTVAAGDVTGDDKADIVTGAGVGGSPHVQVFDGTTGASVHSFFAYAPDFRGGVTVAAGDVTGDGKADVITGAGVGGGPHVGVFDGATGVAAGQWMAFDPGFRGGVAVATADPDGDGRAEVLVAPGAGSEPRVRLFTGTSGAVSREALAFDARFRGGVTTGHGVNRATPFTLPAVQLPPAIPAVNPFADYLADLSQTLDLGFLSATL